MGWSSLASSADGIKLVALVQSASIYTSTNGGATWTPTNPVPGASWRSIASSADGQTLVAAWTGGIEISTNSGAPAGVGLTDLRESLLTSAVIFFAVSDTVLIADS